ncbi:MAG: ATP-dependent zinc metalloprotease FtsH [Chlamydiae bacterium]|nr:ATP-dependent zinc metalloprotease FtsH [Chlamydiota bacterium]
MSQESKKGFGGGFFLLILGAIFMMLTLQNLSEKKTSSVAFNYQVEHLINLGLIDPNYSFKIPESDHMVTFRGKFHDTLDTNSKDRYAYLKLLKSEIDQYQSYLHASNELDKTAQEIREVANVFLEISGVPLSDKGYTVVGRSYDLKENESPHKFQRANGIVIRTPPKLQFKTFQQIETSFLAGGNEEKLRSDLDQIIDTLLSSKISIYHKGIRSSLKGAKSLNLADALVAVKSTIDDLNKEEQDLRLLPTRSVRNYKHYLAEWRLNVQNLAETQEKLDTVRSKVKDITWYYNDAAMSSFKLEETARSNPDQYARWFNQARSEWDAFEMNRGSAFTVYSQQRNMVLDTTFKTEEPTPGYINYIFTLMPLILIISLLYFIFSRQIKGVGGGAMSFGKSPARLLTPSLDRVTFSDVAGIDEVREELVEIVDFLKDSSKYVKLGAKIPKGVLLVGPPGTGKTLLAKAVAGEANCPFFSISGSDFVEMFVGVGASRVRDLFEQARKNAPCIIFIDEIDAVGRSRGVGYGGGHDEREQTLNQLLVEMDGMNPASGIILIAATNRPDVLDKALLRPGRIDRQVFVNLPDLKGRTEILRVHASKYKLDLSCNLEAIAKMTTGTAGAHLANMMNEAALIAAKKGRAAIFQADLEMAVDKVRFGKERKSMKFSQDDIRSTGYHESGHAIVAMCLKNADPVERVTVIPRQQSLGHTAFRPQKDRLSYWKREAVDYIAVLMGGQVAEEIFVGDISSGARQDIKMATNLARSMICEWGMSDILGKVYYEESSSDPYVMTQKKEFSEETAKLIDQEVKKIIDSGYQKAKEILITHKDKVQIMTDALLKYETIDNHDAVQIMEGTFSFEQKEGRLRSEEEALQAGRGVAPIELKSFNGNINPSQT